MVIPGVVLLVGLGTLIDLKRPGSLVRIPLVENQIRRIPLFVIIVISQVTLNENDLDWPLTSPNLQVFYDPGFYFTFLDLLLPLITFLNFP